MLDDLSRNVHVPTIGKHLSLKVELGRNRFTSLSRITLMYSTVSSKNLKIKIYRTIILPVVFMGVKLGR